MSQALPILIKLYPKYSFGTTGSILPSAISSKAFPTGLEEWYYLKALFRVFHLIHVLF